MSRDIRAAQDRRAVAARNGGKDGRVGSDGREADGEGDADIDGSFLERRFPVGTARRRWKGGQRLKEPLTSSRPQTNGWGETKGKPGPQANRTPSTKREPRQPPNGPPWHTKETW